MTVTVYSTPSCVQCKATYRALEKGGIPFNVVDLTQDMEAMARVRSMGYQQAPVVMTGELHWSGYRPDMINNLQKAAVPQQAAA